MNKDLNKNLTTVFNKEYIFISRYNDKYILKQSEDCEYDYLFTCEIPDNFYYRIMVDPKTDEIQMFDPSGGPAFYVGDELRNYVGCSKSKLKLYIKEISNKPNGYHFKLTL